MILKYIIPVLVFIPVAFFQVTFVPWIAVENAVPFLPVILLVFYTHSRGQLAGTILGFVYGIIFDFLAGGLAGAGMFSLTIAGFAAGYFHNENKIAFYDEPHLFILSVFISTVVFSLSYSLTSLGDLSYNFWALMIEHVLLPAVYTTAVSFLLLIFRKVKSFR